MYSRHMTLRGRAPPAAVATVGGRAHLPEMMPHDALPQPPLLIASDIYRKSRYGTAHPLSIPRVSTVVDLCRSLGWLPAAQYVDSPVATIGQLARFHDPAYIAALKQAEDEQDAPPDIKARYNIGISNNPIYAEMFRRPATACGGSILAAELVKNGGTVYHPPGGTHHGRADRASGFCYFNDPVLGLLRLLDLGVAPVLYVDLDAHHGDGVQDAFHGDDRVFTISIHEENRWPRTGPADDRAGGAAATCLYRAVSMTVNWPTLSRRPSCPWPGATDQRP